jgi:heme exporter protein A
MTSVIEARALGKSYGPTPVLRGVNLAVEAGRGVALIGSNGAGKSTLIRLLAGLASPTAGEAMLFGEPARSLAPDLRRRVGLLSHQSFLYPNLTARENLEFYARIYGVQDARAQALFWIGRIALAAAADFRVRTFSRGMEQRLAIARALVARPDVLMLDEPFSALDPDGVSLAASVIREAMDRGCAVIATAHSPGVFADLGLEVVALRRGRLFVPAPDAASEAPPAMALARQVS